MGWCEANKVHYLFGLARNQRLSRIIGAQRQQARVLHRTTGKAARVFTGFAYVTRNSWSRARRVVAKAEYLDKGENPRFVVTSLSPDQWPDRHLYEKFYGARGEMENRIKQQMCLFADRLSTGQMQGNQLRLYFSALAYTLMEALRRLGLKGTEWAQAQVDTIRLKRFKIDAIVKISVRRILLQLSSTYPWKDLYAHAFHALRCRSPLRLHNPMPTLLHVAGLAEPCAKVTLQSPKEAARRQKLPGPLTPMPKIEATDWTPTQTWRRISAREKSGLGASR
jgi:hypothetical protein